MSKVQPIPPGYSAVLPYLVINAAVVCKIPLAIAG